MANDPDAQDLSDRLDVPHELARVRVRLHDTNRDLQRAVLMTTELQGKVEVLSANVGHLVKDQERLSKTIDTSAAELRQGQVDLNKKLDDQAAALGAKLDAQILQLTEMKPIFTLIRNAVIGFIVMAVVAVFGAILALVVK